ncbi:hypothetical protein D3C81_2067410 [compost metagenome]
MRVAPASLAVTGGSTKSLVISVGTHESGNSVSAGSPGNASSRTATLSSSKPDPQNRIFLMTVVPNPVVSLST